MVVVLRVARVLGRRIGCRKWEMGNRKFETIPGAEVCGGIEDSLVQLFNQGRREDIIQQDNTQTEQKEIVKGQEGEGAKDGKATANK